MSDSKKFWVPIPYLKISDLSVAGEDQERANCLLIPVTDGSVSINLEWLCM
jgi:hypothetical protein